MTGLRVWLAIVAALVVVVFLATLIGLDEPKNQMLLGPVAAVVVAVALELRARGSSGVESELQASADARPIRRISIRTLAGLVTLSSGLILVVVATVPGAVLAIVGLIYLLYLGYGGWLVRPKRGDSHEATD